jgi:hypothetical protein
LGTVDPMLEYVVPDKVTAVIVSVIDSQGRAGPRGVYRLFVTPQGGSKPGFQLHTPTQRIILPVGGRTVVPIHIEREGYEGLVELSAEGLPEGTKLEGADIPEGADGALVTVVRGEAAPTAVITRWRGRTDGDERLVSIKGHVLERLQPWLANEMALATSTASGTEYLIDWRGLPADAGLVPASKLALPLTITKPAGNAIVRLSLITSQVRPLVNGQIDPNQALRVEKPVELPATATEGEVTVLVPPLPIAPVYDLTIQAEFLTPDKKTVLAVAYAPVRRMMVRHQIVVQLEGAPKFETALDPKTGATLKLQGQIERREGLTSDVALLLTGLPAGARTDAVAVKAGETAFTVNVILPPNIPAGEIAGLKLTGSAVPDAKQPNVRVRSKDVDLSIVVSTK